MENPYITLAIIFSKDRKNVLMMWHQKDDIYDFITGENAGSEGYSETVYRSLKEKAGITRDNIELEFVRHEYVTRNIHRYSERWDMYVMAGIINDDTCMRTDKYFFTWVPVTSTGMFAFRTIGDGNRLTFIKEAASKFDVRLT